MASSTGCDKGLNLIIFVSLIITALFSEANAINIFLEWNVALDSTIRPVLVDQPVITINGMLPGPEAEFDLLIGDWSYDSYKWSRSSVQQQQFSGSSRYHFDEWFRISNVGSTVSFNFRIQNHQMVLVEKEESYSNQITLDSLDVHVGQS
ncbi:hypothetical protein F8388_018755 [Cannabis sativa]|uniref:Plastocyanin-like domain-containing protein n=1 Tax=Cannabis sativa TaxID=3483 RepID=A0A7J6GM99_CANSA|nr:hypothetical protein F8388_018755 [Cannabis sativa]